MKKIFLQLSVLLAVTTLVQCTKADSAEAPGRITDSTAATQAQVDSVKKAKQLEVETKNLSTTQGQINHMKTSGSWAKYETGILPQMAQDAPSYCKQILEKNFDYFIIVDKGKMKLFLYDKYGNIVKNYGIACAKNFGTKQRKGDSRTTEGLVFVKGVFDSTNWLFTNDAGYTSPARGVYGPKFIRLTIPYIGIHGTSSPGSIGRRCSHGCIRVQNQNILELVKYVKEGMPVIISPGPQDMAVNKRDGYNVLSVSTEPGSPKAEPGKHAPGAPAATTTATAPASKKDNAVNTKEEKPAEAVQGDSPAKPETEPAAPAKSEQPAAPAAPAAPAPAPAHSSTPAE